MMRQTLTNDGMELVKAALKSQYRASLLMLENAIALCTDNLWHSDDYPNRTWQMVYHCLYFTNLYLFQHLDQRKNWSQHLPGYQDLGEDEGKQPYTRVALIDFTREILAALDQRVDGLDLNAEDCGFHWYKVNKLEHQFVNLKHLQHHLGQLQDRIRNQQNTGIAWIRDGSGDRRIDQD